MSRGLLQGKEHTAYWSAEGSSDSGRGARRDEITLVVVVAEAFEHHALESQRLRRALR